MIDEFFLRQASIFELRNIARSMGVLSPTIFKKEELIDKVLKIQNGEEKPQMPKSRQGRPPKSVFAKNSVQTLSPSEKYVSYKELVSRHEPTSSKKSYFDNTPEFYFGKFTSNEILANSDLNYGAGLYEEQDKKSEFGYFNIVDNEFGFIFDISGSSNVEDVVFVPHNLIKTFGLRCGDVVEFKSSFVQNATAKFVSEIISINNDTELKNRIDFDSLKFDVTQNNCLDISASGDLFNAKCGSRNIICVKSNAEIRTISKKFSALTNNYHIINLFLDIMPEDIANMVTGTKIENFFTPIGESNKQNIQTVVLAIERVKRLVESGKKVILLASECKKIIKQQNFSLDYSAEDIKYKSLDLCYALLSLARNLNNNTNITTFMFLKEGTPPSSFESYLLEDFKSIDCNIFKFE